MPNSANPNQLIWIYTVGKGMGPAGQGLKHKIVQVTFIFLPITEPIIVKPVLKACIKQSPVFNIQFYRSHKEKVNFPVFSKHLS